MTDKELRALRRTELLEMMIEGRDAVAAAEAKLEEERARRLEAEEENRKLQETFEWLRRQADEKDEKIHALEEKLAGANDRREDLTEQAKGVAEATARLNEAAEAAENARKLFEAALKSVRKKSAGEGDRP